MKIKAFLILISLIAILSIGTVSAEDNATFYVSVGGSDSNAGSESSPYATLNQAIESSNPSQNTTIYIGEGQFSGSGNINININLDHVNNGGSLSIVGAGVNNTYFNGEFSNAIFSAMSSSSIVSISGISFINCVSSNGGAISSGADLIISDCLFANNYATMNFGGAIYWQNYGNGNLTVENSVFEQNTAQYRGGAIYAFSTNTFNLYNCNFTSNGITNSYSYGVDVYDECDVTNLINNLFENTTAQAGPDGAVYVSAYGQGILINNTFLNCANNGNKSGILYLDGNNYLEGNIFINSNTVVGNIYNSGNMNVLITPENYTITDAPVNLNLSSTITDIDGNTITGQSATFYIDNNLINTTTLVNGKVMVSYTVDSYENHTIGVVYNNQLGNGSISAVNNKRNSITSLSYFNDSRNSVTLMAVVSGDDGIVTFNIGGEEFNVTVENKQAIVKLDNLSIGNYYVVATYSGDNNFNPSSDQLNFTISESIQKDNSTVSLNVVVDYIHKNIIITATCSGDGTVIFNVNGETYNKTTDNDVATLTLNNLKNGNYSVLAIYGGNNQFYPSANTTKFVFDGYRLAGSDVEMYYKNGTRYEVKLTLDNKGVVGEIVNITINGISYERLTNDEGIASLGLNLNQGNYTVTTTYGDLKINNSVVIKPSLVGNNLTKYFRNASQYSVEILGNTGLRIANGTVEFNINGVFYQREISNGVATLNINLSPGDYIITAISPNGDRISNNIAVLSLIEDNHNLTKYYRNSSQYNVKILDNHGKLVVGKNVSFNINGVFYQRATNEEGVATLAINLRPGNYIVTAEYEGCLASNLITVISTIESENIWMSSSNRYPFEVRVLDDSGNPKSGAHVRFNINGVIYNKISNEYGIASLDINLMAGEYIITTTYDKLSQANTIIIY